jgi:hypothetical protein
MSFTQQASNILSLHYSCFDQASDNGYHIGQHRLQPGKELGFEEDINVPLIIRGPGVSKNVTTKLVTTHTDLSPTILNLIGEKPRPDFDGVAIPVHSGEIEEAEAAITQKWQEHINVEYWGLAIGEGQFGSGVPSLNNTYKGLRIVAPKYSFYYSVWCNDAHELYDVVADPGQLDNLLSPSRKDSGGTVLGLPTAKVAARLDSLLFVLKSCKGHVCVDPWKTLHPEGGVSTLEDALDRRFDGFYEVEQTRIKYSRCEAGYIVDAEGAQFDVDGLVFRHGVKWSEWV